MREARQALGTEHPAHRLHGEIAADLLFDGADAEARAAALAGLQEAARPQFRLVPWLLLGLAGSAVAALLLSWAQGYVMARFSDRIAADLRNQAYAHLQRLSLEFFGGKRTGDLIARISSDTDRICTFLSDNLVDFATDCLMIVGTAAILLSIDPLLAAAASRAGRLRTASVWFW